MVKVLKLKGILPEDFRESHELCFYLHDRIADVVVIGEKFNLYEQEIIFRSEKDHEEFEAAVDTVKILNWLKERNYTDELNHIYLKQVYVALVSDLAHFIYEALIASAKGKNTVAFALLRKPLKDNLFMLENLLINKEHFHELFTDDQGFIKLVNDRVNETNKKELIDKVLNITELGFDKSFIYDARYNKKYIDGFEPIWQQANHLITTCPHYRTQTGNINFVFSNTENRFEQWRLLYSVLPKLLFYTFKIIMKISQIYNHNYR